MISKLLKSKDFIGVAISNNQTDILIQVTDREAQQARSVLTIQETLELISDLVQAVSKINEMQRHNRKTDPEGIAKPS